MKNVEELIERLENYISKYDIDDYVRQIELKALELRNAELSYWFLDYGVAKEHAKEHLEIIYSSKNWDIMLKLVNDYSRYPKNQIDWLRISNEILASKDLEANYKLAQSLNMIQRPNFNYKGLELRHYQFVSEEMSRELNRKFNWLVPPYNLSDERIAASQQEQQIKIACIIRKLNK